MKIDETCMAPAKPVRFDEIPIGTVFKYKNHNRPFLRLFYGIVDLANNLYYARPAEAVYDDYTPFPAARVVLK